MAKTYWKIVNQILDESNIIIQVLDARFPQETRNKELEQKIEKANKKIIYAINKTDLVSELYRKKIEKMFAYKSFALLTVKDHKGAQALRVEIKKAAQGKEVTVGVCGYPNTGKSSVINALKGAHVAKTSPKSGYTTGAQKIKMNEGIYLMDTPGVLQFDETDETKLALVGALSKEHIHDPESVALNIIKMFLDANGEMFAKFYEVDISSCDEQEILENLAKKTRLLKGGEGDTIAASKRIIEDWQKGRIGLN